MPAAAALIVTGVDTVELGSVEIPAPGRGEVAVDLDFTAISPGTEARAMRGQQEGVSFPYVPGYSGAGRIAAIGPGVTLAVGTPVYVSGTQRLVGIGRAWGGHVARAVAKADAVIPLPSGCDTLAASAAHLAAIAYHGVRLARPLPDERVCVVGLGPIGLLSALIYRVAGTRVVAVDRSAARIERARALGIEAVLVSGTIADAVLPLLPDGADIVVDATGFPPALPQAVAVARTLAWGDDHAQGARFVIQGSYPVGIEIPYQAVFQRELQLLVPRACTPRDLRAVLDLVARCSLPLRDLISKVAAPTTASEVYAELRQADTTWVTAAFRWRDAT